MSFFVSFCVQYLRIYLSIYPTWHALKSHSYSLLCFPALFIYSLLSHLFIASLISYSHIHFSSHFFYISDSSLISVNHPFRSLLAYCATSQSLTPQGSSQGRNRESVETTTSEVRSSWPVLTLDWFILEHRLPLTLYHQSQFLTVISFHSLQSFTLSHQRIHVLHPASLIHSVFPLYPPSPSLPPSILLTLFHPSTYHSTPMHCIAEVIKWFAERADMIIVMFDAHKLDISDELKTVLDVLKPHQDKIRYSTSILFE